MKESAPGTCSADACPYSWEGGEVSRLVIFLGNVAM